MASKVALAKAVARERQELKDSLARIEAKLDQLLAQGAAKPAPVKRARRQKRTGTDA